MGPACSTRSDIPAELRAQTQTQDVPGWLVSSLQPIQGKSGEVINQTPGPSGTIGGTKFSCERSQGAGFTDGGSSRREVSRRTMPHAGLGTLGLGEGVPAAEVCDSEEGTGSHTMRMGGHSCRASRRLCLHCVQLLGRHSMASRQEHLQAGRVCDPHPDLGASRGPFFGPASAPSPSRAPSYPLFLQAYPCLFI